MIEEKVKKAVQQRIETLLFDDSITNYKDHETFLSHKFLIWKLQPINWSFFSKEIESLIKHQGYECIPGAWDVSTFNSENNTGYKVVALYKIPTSK